MGAMIRFDPFETAFNELFRSPHAGPWFETRAERTLSMDVFETHDAYLVSVDVPGVPKDAINVSIFQNQLTVEVEARREKDAGAELKPLLAERTMGKSRRTIALPVEVDDGAAEARHVDGVLHLRLPKKAESQAKKLTIG